jgi:tRNA A37 threonylcarbamoyladenosine synthetase subunit TsaC/SUA5/YrdC
MASLPLLRRQLASLLLLLPQLAVISAFALPSSSARTTWSVQPGTSTALFGKRMKFQQPSKVVPETQFLQVASDGSDAWRMMDLVDILDKGGVGVLPTDTGYGIVTPLNSKTGVERLGHIYDSECNKSQHWSLLVSQLSHIDDHCHMYGLSKSSFKLLKNNLPGPYTFILPSNKSTKAVLKKYSHQSESLGVRIPNDPVMRYLQDDLLETSDTKTPLLMVELPNDDDDDDDDEESRETLQVQRFMLSVIDATATWSDQVDFIVDAGPRPINGATVWDMTALEPRLLKEGLQNSELAALSS